MPDRPAKLRLFALSGSLRKASSNTAVLRALRTAAAEMAEIDIFDRLAEIPPFNPDDEAENRPTPAAVQDFRRRIQSSDAILISTPEYAHGVPGVLKNALDWVVGSGEFVGKRTALVNPSPRSTWAQASLTETLTVMSAILVPSASVTLDLTTNRVDEAMLLASPETVETLRRCVAALSPV
jgi:chromate reductase, NAD(P)H dehydrogenase (quinone)